jgi:hypothetical protein
LFARSIRTGFAGEPTFSLGNGDSISDGGFVESPGLGFFEGCVFVVV